MKALARTVVISSCVGGGPMERLVRRLIERGVSARFLAGASPDRWRCLMRGGASGRVCARIGAMIGFPIRALFDAFFCRGSLLVPTTNPFFLPVLLVAVRPFHRQPVVPLVYDLYPDALEAGGLARAGSFASRIAESANRYLFRRADGIVFIGQRMGAHARRRYGEPKAWAVLETGADSEEFSAEVLGRTGAETDLERWCEGRVVLGYVGNLGLIHDWATLAEAVRQLVPRVMIPFSVVVAGSGPGIEHLRKAWADLPEGIVRFEPPLEDRSWARLLRLIGISLVTLRPDAKYTSIPSKTFSAMAAGSAIAAIVPIDSDVADVVTRHGCGIVIQPDDPEGAANALVTLIDDQDRLQRMRTAAKMAVESEYDMPCLVARWRSFLDEVVAARRRDSGSTVRRLLDVLVSAGGLLVLSPFLIMVAIAIRMTMGAPVFFRQGRPGLGGKAFRLFKFRTMCQPCTGEKGPESDAARLTKLGAFLRATSIDELPTLLNVLKGDMSLVGPRPLLMRYLSRYTPRQARRHEVRPGITGWAQVNGRNAISWEQKLALDVWYVENRSLWLDFRILARTVLKVFIREGINHNGYKTMPEFMGGNEKSGVGLNKPVVDGVQSNADK